MKSSLENKRVRPSIGLDNYTGFYKQPDASSAKTKKSTKSGVARPNNSTFMKVLGVIALVAVVGLIASALNSHPAKKPVIVAEKTNKKVVAVVTPNNTKPAPPVTAPATSSGDAHCAGNQLEKLALVSISERHMWACAGSKSVYDSPVITGIASVAETETPTGTYKIYAKQKDVTLTGSDSTGSWNDPVSYWMPFLINTYGVYGFHDAQWRPKNEFGNIDPNSKDGSHGCVELPIASSAWLYNWAPVGTVVTIAS